MLGGMNRPIVDAHLDLAWNALSYGRDITQPLDTINAYETGMTDAKCRGHATVSLPAMREGDVRLCGGTLLARVKPDVRPDAGFNRLDIDYAAAPIAHGIASGQLAYYELLQQQGHIRLIHDAGQLDAHWRDTADDAPLGVILAMEGADPIVDIEHVADWHQRGLRIVNLVHYGHNRFAAGTGTDGPLTGDGRALLEAFESLGMIVDLTHLSDTSMTEVLERYPGPVFASHHNCRALVPHPRQLTDQQIRAIVDRHGVIAVALDAWMLVSNWSTGTTPRNICPLSKVVDHIDHICQLAGDCRQVAIGSDLDGGFGSEETPDGLESIADLQKLAPLLADRGYSEPDIDAIFHGNLLSFFQRHLPAGE